MRFVRSAIGILYQHVMRYPDRVFNDTDIDFQLPRVRKYFTAVTLDSLYYVYGVYVPNNIHETDDNVAIIVARDVFG